MFNAVKHFARIVNQLLNNNVVYDGTPNGHKFNSKITKTLDMILEHFVSEQVHCSLKRITKDTNVHQLDEIEEDCKFSQATNCQCELREYIVLERIQLYIKNVMNPSLLELCRSEFNFSTCLRFFQTA